MRRLAYATIGAALIAPAQIALYALVLKRAKRRAPETFDGPSAARSVAICLDEYKREMAAGEYQRPWNQSPWLD